MHPRAWWDRHWLFAVLLLVSLVPRALALLGFRPALTIRDSFDYMHDSVYLTLGQLRPDGYSMLLRLLEPFHSLELVTSLQHLLGLGIAVIVYGMLRHWGLPGWGACLAAAPTLFDFREIALESVILADLVYGFVVVAAVALLLTKSTPRIWRCTLAGLLIGYASLLRGNGLPLIVPVLAAMLVRRAGWRAVTAGAAAFAIPVLTYMSLFYASWGTFNLTNSDGLFLWSRTTSFANCAIIKPPRNLVPLCPSRAHLHGTGRSPADYLWAANAWFQHDKQPGFNAANNALAMQFALRAIEAQPLGYAKAVASDVLATFLATDRGLSLHTMAFTAAPDVPRLPLNWARALRDYGHTTSNTHPVQPYADLILRYQGPVYFSGLMFLAVVIAGLAGVLRKRRQWGGPGALPWAVAAVSIVLPPMLTYYAYRYVLVAVPLACLAAGLAFARNPAWPQQSRPASRT